MPPRCPGRPCCMPERPGCSRARPALPLVLGQAGLVALGVFVYFRVRGLTEAVRRHRPRRTPTTSSSFERRSGIDVEAALQRPVAPPPRWRRRQLGLHLGPLAGHHRDHDLARLAPPRRVPAAARRDAGLRRPGHGGLRDLPRRPAAAGRPRAGRHGDASSPAPTGCLQPPAFVNQYAAMPSLHAGWDLLVGHGDLRAPRPPGAEGGRLRDAGADGVRGGRDGQPLRRRRGRRASPWSWSGTPSRSRSSGDACAAAGSAIE